MNRGIITISESGTVSMPTDTVWMTMQEIADMYNVFGCYVRKAVKAVFKDGILKEHSVRRHVTGTSLLLEQPEVVKLIWPVPLAWKHASTITQYGMYDFLIYYWTYRLPGTMELSRLP